MHPKQWHEAKDASRGTRTPYQTRDYRDHLCPIGNTCPESTFQDEQWGGRPGLLHSAERNLFDATDRRRASTQSPNSSGSNPNFLWGKKNLLPQHECNSSIPTRSIRAFSTVDAILPSRPRSQQWSIPDKPTRGLGSNLHKIPQIRASEPPNAQYTHP